MNTCSSANVYLILISGHALTRATLSNSCRSRERALSPPECRVCAACARPLNNTARSSITTVNPTHILPKDCARQLDCCVVVSEAYPARSRVASMDMARATRISVRNVPPCGTSRKISQHRTTILPCCCCCTNAPWPRPRRPFEHSRCVCTESVVMLLLSDRNAKDWADEQAHHLGSGFPKETHFWPDMLDEYGTEVTAESRKEPQPQPRSLIECGLQPVRCQLTTGGIRKLNQPL